MKKTVTVSAPGKLMLFGEHAVVYGKPCIVTAVDKRLYVTATIIDSPDFVLEASELKLHEYRKPLSDIGKGDIPKEAQFVEMGVKNFLAFHPGGGGTKNRGVKIKTTSEFTSTYGFGSSSAVTVCAIKALSELFIVTLSNKELFDIAYKTVLDVQGAGSGFDIAAAIWGGTLYFTPKSDEKILQFPKVAENDIMKITVGYTGIKADTPTLIRKVKKFKEKNPTSFTTLLRSIEVLVKKAKLALEQNDWKTIGKLMNENQTMLSQLGVSSPKLDELIKAARNAGAYGAKLSGAGGGDCMITIASEYKKMEIEKAIENAGGEILHVKTNAEGARTE